MLDWEKGIVPSSAPAIWETGRTHSYRELAESVGDWEKRLRNEAEPIVLALPKSFAFVSALLACYFLRKQFVPIDLHFSARVECIRAHFPWGTWIGNEIISRAQPATNQGGYLIFTSGSTGQPKGVILGGEFLREVIENQIQLLQLTSQDRTAWFLSPGFDASLSDLFVTLAAGASLHIPPCKLTERQATTDFMAAQKITYTDLPPSSLGLYADFPSLRVLVVGGEPLPPPSAKKWADQVELWNSYGPTEATISTSMMRVMAEWQHPWLGQPLAGITYRVDEGELWIAGHLAHGYLDANLTREKFVCHEGQRYFRTGDRVREGAHGLYYVGRLDRQFKRSGILICPEEIESALAQRGIRAYAGPDQQDRYTVWYESAFDAKEIRTILGETVDNMPNRYVALEKLPETPNAKIDPTLLC